MKYRIILTIISLLIAPNSLATGQFRWPLILQNSPHLKQVKDLNTTLNTLLHKTYLHKRSKALNLLELILQNDTWNSSLETTLELIKKVEKDESLRLKLLQDGKELASDLLLPESIIKNCSRPKKFIKIESKSQFLIDFREEFPDKKNQDTTTEEITALLTPEFTPWYRLYLLTKLESLLTYLENAEKTPSQYDQLAEKILKEKKESQKTFKNLIYLAKKLLLPESLIWHLATNQTTTWLSEKLLTALYSPKLRVKINKAKKNLYYEAKKYPIETATKPVNIEERIILEAFAKSSFAYIPKQQHDLFSQIYDQIIYFVTGKSMHDTYGITTIKELNSKSKEETIIPVEEEEKEENSSTTPYLLHLFRHANTQ